MSFKYNANTLTTLESIFKENKYVVRYEKGRFQSGYCILQDISYLLIGLDISDTYIERCINYEED